MQRTNGSPSDFGHSDFNDFLVFKLHAARSGHLRQRFLPFPALLPQAGRDKNNDCANYPGASCSPHALPMALQSRPMVGPKPRQHPAA